MKQPQETEEKGTLQRGLSLLRLFRPGVSTLGNGEMAERTGLPRSTVTRLTQMMVESGYLQKGSGHNSYRLGPVVLSLSEGYATGSLVLQVCEPMMTDLAKRFSADVHLAAEDKGEMVYLETVRHRKKAMERRVRPGHRLPVEVSSAGRAWLATLPAADFARALKKCRTRHGVSWGRLRQDILDSRSQMSQYGYCTSHWMPGLVAVATSVCLPDQEVYFLSISISLEEYDISRLHTDYGPALVRLAVDLRERCTPPA
jgi:DNA-binding IclR family transcriptional regulator